MENASYSFSTQPYPPRQRLKSGVKRLMHSLTLGLASLNQQRSKQATLAMVAAAITPSIPNLKSAETEIDRTLLNRARKLIEQHLQNPDLSQHSYAGTWGFQGLGSIVYSSKSPVLRLTYNDAG